MKSLLYSRISSWLSCSAMIRVGRSLRADSAPPLKNDFSNCFSGFQHRVRGA